MTSSKKTDKAKDIVFRGSGVHDPKELVTSAGSNKISPANPAARISYTVSYPGGLVHDGGVPEEIAEKIKDDAAKSIAEEIRRSRVSSTNE